jgi:hypothetical protein
MAVKDVVEAMKLVSDGIKAMETFVSACKDGQQYLKSQQPNIRADLSVMCSEVRKTLLAIAVASSAVTNFRFTVAGRAVDTEPRRFNEYFIQFKPQEAELRRQINSSRGHCDKIKKHAEKMDKKAKSRGLGSLFNLLGINSKEREKELSENLFKIYEEDHMFHMVVDKMIVAITQTFNAVQAKLGSAGTMNPANVKEAARVLGAQADKFSRIESRCLYLAGELENVINDISPEGGK